jgi:hypothetical protein
MRAARGMYDVIGVYRVLNAARIYNAFVARRHCFRPIQPTFACSSNAESASSHAS